MSLKKNDKGVIRLGDATDHGGEVVSVAHKPTDLGCPPAYQSDAQKQRSQKVDHGLRAESFENSYFFSAQGAPLLSASGKRHMSAPQLDRADKNIRHDT